MTMTGVIYDCQFFQLPVFTHQFFEELHANPLACVLCTNVEVQGVFFCILVENFFSLNHHLLIMRY